MVEKRGHPGGDGAGTDSKRIKPDISEAIARAKARAEEAKRRREQQMAGQAPVQAPQPVAPVQSGAGLASLQARMAAFKSQAAASPSPPPAPPSPTPKLTGLAALQARLAAEKAKVAAAAANGARPPPPPPPPEPEPSQTRGGLSIGLHPALLNDVADVTSKKQPMAPKFATTMANRRTESPVNKQLDLSGPDVEEFRQNPYFDPRLSTMAGRERTRVLIFNQKGKYVEQANALRAQARLELLKKELADAARKAGVDENSERGFLVQEPPEVEWWDEGLLTEKTYDCIDDPQKLKITGKDSIITSYVQHPVLLKAPQEQRLIKIKPMYLTAKEQAKLRRMRRAADLKETQAKIRLGLEPPPPPKVKRGNMMRVMGEQAIADPTAVEMLVEKQIRERAEAHEKANEERMLTKEQRHEKLAQQQETDAKKGLYICVFKVDSLVFGKHRYQVDVNAKQNVLTGVTILNPKFNLVIVEGGWHSIHNYKKLMLNRVKWTENTGTSSISEKKDPEPEWLRSVDEDGKPKDLSGNKCSLIFEGEVKDRSFRKWNIKICETDGDAREYLGKSKLDSLWALGQGAE